jgi:hypothetical protein
MTGNRFANTCYMRPTYDSIRTPSIRMSLRLPTIRASPGSPQFADRGEADNNLLLLHTNYDAGHAGASGRYDYLKEVAVDYAFMIDRLCSLTTPLEIHAVKGI